MRAKSAQPVPREDGTLPPKRPPAPSIRRRPGQRDAHPGQGDLWAPPQLVGLYEVVQALLGLLTLGLVTGVYS